MKTKIKNALFCAALLLCLPLIQGCSDDKADPVAHHVKVKYLYFACSGSHVLQILNQRYAAMGQKDFLYIDGQESKRIAAVAVTHGTVGLDNLKPGEVLYVDMERAEDTYFQFCDFPPYTPGTPDVHVDLLKIY